MINTRRSKPVNYRVLHRASCRFIKNDLNNKIEGAFTQRAYIKICATEVISLKMWTDKEHPRGVLYSKKCMCCAPYLSNHE